MTMAALLPRSLLMALGVVWLAGTGAAGCSSTETPHSGTGGTQADGGSGGQGAGGANGGQTGSGEGGSRQTGGVDHAGGRVTTGGATSGRAGGTPGGKDAAADLPLSGNDASDASGGEPRRQGTRPEVPADACGAWSPTEGVCCARYCSNDNTSESCDKCGGPSSATCQVVNAKACTSGEWPEVHSVGDNEPWHYSRSTHFGTAPMGACAFGLYGLCSSTVNYEDKAMKTRCEVFCKAYPDLCKDPSDTTLRGNFAAPQGNYYTQFWSSLPGDLDNYLSCGECFELVRTQNDGSEYQSTVASYTPPVVLQIADSCPCAANSKWCCGSGRDHCGEVQGTFTHGCPLPPSPPPPPDHDPMPNESIHFDLSDIAMARLQTANPTGNIRDGVIPTKYRRVPCPVVGTIHVWMRPNAGPYYFSLTVVNMAGLGAAAKVEAQLPSGEWVGLIRDKNYSLSRPQERYGTWALPQGYGPFSLPLTLRIADGSGKYVTAKDVVKTWAPEDASLSEMWFIDLGVQF